MRRFHQNVGILARTSFGVSRINPFGKVWFIDPVNGSDGNPGTLARGSLATIGEAHSRAQPGDALLLALGTYTENVVITKDYIALIGAVAAGYARPDITPTTGIGLLIDNAQGVALQHLRVVSADGAALVNEGNGFWFDDLVLEAFSDGLLLVGDVLDDSYTASEGIVENSLFRDCANGIRFKNPGPPAGVGTTDNVIQRNRFYRIAGADFITQHTAGGNGKTCTDTLIRRNYHMDIDKAVYYDMDQQTGDNPVITGNYFADDAALDATKIDVSGTQARVIGNFNAIGLVDGSSFDD